MKYAIVGAGSRHQMYREALAETPIGEGNELVALCDTNPLRLALSAGRVPRQSGNGIATYLASEFDRMIAEQRPDRVVVTTPDYLHDEYIVRALRSGCDVITEKPMTTSLGKLRAIVEAQRETGRNVTVTFNYRYNPAHTQLKDLLMGGAIGDITSVDFRWHLDRVHGADYFRRWHRYKDRSGGLLVHKSTHHFDLVNWWVASRPKTVAALGKRVFYTPGTAAGLGLGGHGERCLDCPVAARCDYRLDIGADSELRALYLEAEDADGYYRDRCVFAPDITIEDNMQVQVRYANDVFMNYTLNAHSPWEGYEIIFYGTKGELTHKHVGVHGTFGGERHHADAADTMTMLHVHGKPAETREVWSGEGDHGGGDPVMLAYLLDGGRMGADRYERGSTQVDGAWSILTGLAANRSMETGEVVDLARMTGEAGIVL